MEHRCGDKADQPGAKGCCDAVARPVPADDGGLRYRRLQFRA
jgi:hypothetical protein